MLDCLQYEAAVEESVCILSPLLDASFIKTNACINGMSSVLRRNIVV